LKTKENTMSKEPTEAQQPVVQYAPVPLTPSEERTWAMLANLSVLLNLVTGFLGAVAALIIYLVFREKSRYVAYHAMQSFLFQLIFWGAPGLILAVMWGLTGALSLVLVGLLCIPFACILTPVILLMPVISLVYGVVAAIQTSQGRDFKYWLVGDWVRGTLTGE
jgi:uncharacterized Tic20 family protein